MTYLNTHARTTSPTKNDLFQPTGRMPALFGVFMAYIKDAKDVQKNGRLRVWVPELGSAPDNENGWIIVNYCSPFAGATNVDTISTGNPQDFKGTQTSYGMWMVPPDVNNIVAVMFLNGDPVRGIWIGCLLNQYMNNMIPGMAASSDNYQYQGKNVPVAEYNKWDPTVSTPDQTTRPYEQTKFQGVGNQGLITDEARGITNTSARRESPSNVFGILTPGPVIDSNATPENIRRKGGSSFIMDDGAGSEYVQFATKTGAQVKIDETNGFVYLINRDGTAWVEMDKKGNVNIFGATNISMRAQQDINLRADRNINIEAGQNIYMKAAKDTETSTTTFTYDVNNVPQPSTIPYYKYVGEGAGLGGNIVFQALNNVHSTVENNMYLKVGIDYNLEVIQNVNISSTNTNVTASTAILLDAPTVSQGSGGVGMTYEGGTLNISTPVNFGDDVTIGSTANPISLQVIGTSLFSGEVDLAGDLHVAGSTELNDGFGANFKSQWSANADTINSGGTMGGAPSVVVPTISAPPTPGTPTTPAPAEVKPLAEKVNILATWADPTSKFKRNAESMQTTVSTLPTYEPCPEHEQFTFKSVTGYIPKTTQAQSSYEGSGGAGNSAAASPVTNTDPGANNTDLPTPSATDSALVKDFNLNAYECQLKIHEGVKYKSYLDSLGLPTAGIGHLLRANEITQYPVPTAVSSEQVDAWFQQDAPISIAGAQRLLTTDVWANLTDIRKRACADLCYNMGESRLSKFKVFLSNMKAGNYTLAGDSLRDSKWFTQVGRRGPNIITMIIQNIDPNGCDAKFPPT